jgi:hypothetical protein
MDIELYPDNFNQEDFYEVVETYALEGKIDFLLENDDIQLENICQY